MSEQIASFTDEQLVNAICEAWETFGHNECASQEGCGPYRDTDPEGWERAARMDAELEEKRKALHREILHRFSRLRVRDSNVTFHSRNVMAVNEALRKRVAELEDGIVAENRRVTKKIDALVAAGDALAEVTKLSTIPHASALNSWEKAKDV